MDSEVAIHSFKKLEKVGFIWINFRPPYSIVNVLKNSQVFSRAGVLFWISERRISPAAIGSKISGLAGLGYRNEGNKNVNSTFLSPNSKISPA